MVFLSPNVALFFSNVPITSSSLLAETSSRTSNGQYDGILWAILGSNVMWAHLSCNLRNVKVLPFMAVCSKPIPGLKMKTRNFGKKSRHVILGGEGSTLMYSVHLFKLSPNLSPQGCYFLIELIQYPGFGRNKVLLPY